MNIILGNGITAYIIAACFEHTKEPFEIYGPIDKKTIIPNILLLKCNNLDEAKKYCKILNCSSRNITQIKIGYYYDNAIHSTLTEEAKRVYLAKQGRISTSSSMSDGSSTFLAINLKNCVKNLIKKYPIKFIETYNYHSNDTVYDTMDYYGLIFGDKSVLYVTKNNSFDVLDYDYVYDCTSSNIKRYTKDTIEYLEKQKCSKKIYNYYNEPTIYVKGNIVILGRYATKTQLKQKDIIDYIIFGKGHVEYV